MACGKKKLRKRLKRLWESDPRCSWCGRPTVLMQGPENANLKVWPNNRATIDHLDHKFLGQRGKTTGPRTVLSCYRCNQQQNVIDIDHYTVQIVSEHGTTVAPWGPIEMFVAKDAQ